MSLYNMLRKGLAAAVFALSILVVFSVPFIDAPIFGSDQALAANFNVTVNVRKAENHAAGIGSANVAMTYRLYYHTTSWFGTKTYYWSAWSTATTTANASGVATFSLPWSTGYDYYQANFTSSYSVYPEWRYPYTTPTAYSITPSSNTSLTFYLELDDDAPSRSLSSPDYSASSSFPVSWSGNDPANASGVAGCGISTFSVYYKYEDQPEQLWLTVPYATKTSTFTSPNGDGLYQFRATSVDWNGNHLVASSGSYMDSTIVDTHLPTAEVAMASTYYGPVTWVNDAIQGPASDIGTGIKLVEVTIRRPDGKYWRGSSWGSFKWLTANYSLLTGLWSYPIGLTASPDFFINATTYTIQVRATDSVNQGMIGTGSFIWDSTAPTSQVTKLPTYETTETFMVSWTGSDATSGIANYDVQYRVNGGGWTPWLTSTTELSSAFTGSTGNNYGFRSKATDIAGNIETYQANPDTVTTVDAVVPTATINMSDYYSVVMWNQGGASSIKGKLFDVGTSIKSTLITLRRQSDLKYWSGSNWLSSTTNLPPAISGQDWSYNLSQTQVSATVPPLLDETFFLTLVATDQAGNTTTATKTFKFDPNAPIAHIGEPFGGVVFSSGLITITGEAYKAGDPGATYVLTSAPLSDPANTTLIKGGSATIAGAQTFATYPISNFPSDGTYLLNLKVTATSGMYASETVPVIIDTVAPVTNYQILGTLGDNSWYTSQVTVILIASDAGTGVVSTFYQIDSNTGAWQTGTTIQMPEGQHRIYYYSTDAAGHIETAKYVDIKVDTTLPSIPVVGFITPTNSSTQNITIAVDADTTVTVNGSAANPGTPWTYFISSLAEGANPFTVVSKDPAGNTRSTKIYIVYDNTAPTTLYSASGTVGSNDFFRSNVTVTLNPVDDISGPDTVYYTLDSVPAQSQTFPVTINVIGDGEHNISFYTVDKAGNVETSQSKVIKIDTLKPSAPSASFTSPTSQMDQTITGTTDALTSVYVDGNAASAIGSNWNFTVALAQEGNNVFDVYAVDQAGNTSDHTTVTIARDTTAPVTDYFVISGTAGENNWYRTNVSVSLDPSDNVAGVDTLFYDLDGVANQATVFPVTIAVSGEGTHALSYYSIDKAGNIEDLQTKEIKIDTIAPAAPSSIVYVSPTKEAGQVISGKTDTGTRVFVNGIQATVTGDDWSLPITLTSQGGNIFNIVAKDDAGNPATATITIVYDTVKPTAALKIKNDDAYTNSTTVTLGIDVSTNVGTTITKMRFKNPSDGSYSAWEDISTVRTGWILESGDGTKTVLAQVKDQAGNISDAVSDTIMLDMTAPSIDGILLNSNDILDEALLAKNPAVDLKLTKPDASIALDCSDAFEIDNSSALVELIDTTDALVWATSGQMSFTITSANLLPAGKYTLRVTISDKAGNSTTTDIRGITVSGGSPTVTSAVIASPNPFNPLAGGSMKIWFSVSADPTAQVGVYIHDMTGRLIWKKVYLASDLSANYVLWTGYNDYSEVVGNGVYLVRVVDETNKKLIGKTKIAIVKKII